MNPEEISAILSRLDPVAYLNSRGFYPREHGENISSKKGWMGLNCFFCPEGDDKGHLGINVNSKTYSCWRCSSKGNMFGLIMHIERCSFLSAVNIAKKFSGNLPDIERFMPEDRRRIALKVDLSGFTDQLLPLHRSFLVYRKFDPDFIFTKYKLRCCGPIGDKPFRLIVPMFNENMIVSYVARDVTGKAEKPYLNLDDDLSIIPPKYHLYNLQNAKDVALVLEGITDSWRIGDGSVATLGIKHTPQQVAELRRFKRIFIMYDGEPKAIEMAHKLAWECSSFNSDVQVIELASGDPCEMKEDDVKMLRTEIFGRVY